MHEAETKNAIAAGDSAVVGETQVFDGRLVTVQTVNPDSLPDQFGRYRIRKLLGRGGMGSVYLADDPQLNRQVALKVPRVAGKNPETLVTRLIREARAVASLQHANICPVFEVGELNGIHFLAMAYIEGRPLSHYLQSSKPQSERAVAITIYKIALALEEAHRKGILHRDLKPANIMIDRRGEPMVMDFGLSYRLEDGETRLTQDGTVIGTPSYMAPEQIDQRSPIGPATDIYALGVVLFELLTRRCPFEGNMVSVIGQVLHAPPPKLITLRPGLSPSLIAICERAMAKDPSQRYASMQEFAEVLAAFAKGDVKSPATEVLTPLTEIANLDSLLTAPLVGPATTVRNAGTASTSRPTWIAIPITLGCVVIVALMIYAMRSSADPSEIAANGTAPAGMQNAPAVPMLPVVAMPTPIESTTAKPTQIEPVPTAAVPALPFSPVSIADETPSQATEPPAFTEAFDESTSPAEESMPDNPSTATNTKSKESQSNDDDNDSSRDAPTKLDPDLQNRFEQADRNRDGRLDPSEFPKHVLQRADKNKDGAVTLAEMQQAHARQKEKLFARPSASQRRKLPPPGGRPGFAPPPR